jgi:type I restriction enzyme S subunit
MSLIDITPSDLAVVQHILRRFVPDRDVVAFGSRAKWTAKPASDLDLAILGETPLPVAAIAAMKDAFEESSLPFNVDLIDWATTKDAFRQIIRRDQVLLKSAEPRLSSDEWIEVTLGDLAEIFDGPHATPSKSEAGPVFLGISNLVNGRLDLTTVEHLSEEDYGRWTRRVEPRAGDVVFSYETRLGEAARIPEGLRCCLGRRMGLLRAKADRVDPRFLLYAFLGPDFQETIRSRTIHGSTVDRIPLVDLPTFPIRVPKTLTEQRAIAHILGTLDDKIELNRRMSETLEAMARALFKSWFVDVGLNRVKASKLISDGVLEIGDGYRAKNAELRKPGLPFIRAGNIANGFDTSGAEVLHEDSVRKAGRKVGMQGDVVFTSKGTIGRFARFTEFSPALVYSPQVCFWRSLDWDRLQPSVLWCWMQSDDLQSQIDAVAGQTDMAPYVSLRDQRNMEVPLFPPSQETFARRLDVVLTRQAAAAEETRTLTALRDALLPKLISGQLRVTDADRSVARVS